MATTRELDRQSLRIATPAVLTLAAEPLYDLTDTAILGHVGTTALAGAALASALLAVGYAVFIFLTYGTTATVARLIGSGQTAEATRHGVQALWLGVGAGTIVGLVLWPAAPFLIHLSNPRANVAAAALTYFRISLWGFPALFLVMAGTGVLRGVRDLTTPLWITTSTVSFNVVLELVLIF